MVTQARPQSQVCRCCTCSTTSITCSSVGCVPPILTIALKGNHSFIFVDIDSKMNARGKVYMYVVLINIIVKQLYRVHEKEHTKI